MSEPVNSKDGSQFTNFVSDLIENRKKLLGVVAFRGNTTQNYKLALRELHLMMRKNYKRMIKGVGNNIYPLIVASDYEPGQVSGVGSAFTLYLRDGTSKRISPTPPEYEMLKNIAHMPLALFVIVGPYFDAPISEGWIGTLRSYQSKVSEVLRSASSGEVDLPTEMLSKGKKGMQILQKHIGAWLESGLVTVEKFETFTKEYYPIVEANVQRAASIQTHALLPALQKWKDELGAEWENTYFLIPTVWPVSAINPRYQVISQLVSPQQAKTHIIMIENQSSLKDQRATLGRIVSDRLAALLIFGTETEAQKELVFGLSSRQDVLSIAAAKAIAEYSGVNQGS
jgi:hypothetical protein